MKKIKLKKIKDQVVVITGASSGIGRATALRAAQKGAKVVLASRRLEDIFSLAEEIKTKGGEALAVPTDVSKENEVRNLAHQAVETFGRVDTWINNAGASIFGPVLQNPIAEAKQLFDTNFWGLHYGCQAAVDVMSKNEAGLIINIGSEVSERAVAEQTMYSASKHAVKAYTEGLRTELEKKKSPIKISLIRPAAIDTPFTEHAVNRLEEGEPSLPAPVYHPDVAARAIIECAEMGKRDVFIGGASKFFSVLEHISPRLVDMMMLKMADEQKKGSKKPHLKQNEGLMHAPHNAGEMLGGHKGHVSKSSLWTSASLHPIRTVAVLAGLGIGAAGVYSLYKNNKLPNLKAQFMS